MHTTVVIIICVLLAAVGIWKEVQRPSRAYLALRLLAVVIAVATLACIILPITYTSAINQSVEHEAVLLTEGFDTDSLNTYQHTRVYTLDKSIHQANPKVILLTDAGTLPAVQPKITQLHVLGYGLSHQELEELSPLPIDFHPATSSGIMAVNHTARLVAGQRFQVQGSYHNTSAKPVKLLLNGLSALLDSANLPAQAQTAFSLNDIPKHTGKAVYHLLVLSGKDTLENEPLPLTITAAKPLKVLLLAATPDFENKFLKNWLSLNGYAAAIRTSISKGKTNQEFVNLEKTSLDHLSASTLAGFDVVTTDAAALKALTPAENSALYQQVSQKGLGLIVRADSGINAANWLQGDFPVSISSAQKSGLTRLNIINGNTSANKLNVTPAYITYRENTQPLITDQQNRILASGKLAGAGKVILTTLTPTFSWALAGNTKDYALVWTTLLTKAARKTTAADAWAINSSLPAVGVPATLALQTSPSPQSIHINQTQNAPAQNALLPFEWTATSWPEKAGWQQASSTAESSFSWYAYQKSDWKPLKFAEKAQATRKYATKYASKAAVTKQIQQKIRIEAPKIYFYILLLLACSFLWAESRWLS